MLNQYFLQKRRLDHFCFDQAVADIDINLCAHRREFRFDIAESDGLAQCG